MVFKALRIDKTTQGVKTERQKKQKKDIERKDQGLSPGDSSIRRLGGGGEECGAQGAGKENISRKRK